MDRSDDCRYDYEHVPIAGAVNEVCPMGFPGGMTFSFWEDKVRTALHRCVLGVQAHSSTLAIWL